MDYTAFRNSERAGWSARAAQYTDATARATLQTIPTVCDTQVLSGGRGVSRADAISCAHDNPVTAPYAVRYQEGPV
jgi:hypothetical protein